MCCVWWCEGDGTGLSVPLTFWCIRRWSWITGLWQPWWLDVKRRKWFRSFHSWKVSCPPLLEKHCIRKLVSLLNSPVCCCSRYSPSDDCTLTSSRALCSVALSFNAFAILYTLFSSHRLFQFLLPLLLISKYALLIPHLWKLPSSLQHFQTSSRLAKPSATWLATSLLHSVSLVYIHPCISAGTLWMA